VVGAKTTTTTITKNNNNNSICIEAAAVDNVNVDDQTRRLAAS